MKKYIIDFIRRGLIAGGFGPLVLAILYLVLKQNALIDTLTVNEVCIGIFSIYGLAFIAGGMNFLYQIERLPLVFAILIHGSILYISYFVTYLLNGWLEWGMTPILVYSVIFVLGYLIIWAFIFYVTRKNIKRINEMLKEKQQKTL